MAKKTGAKKSGKSSKKAPENPAFEALNRAFLIGLGATVRTTDRLRDSINQMVEEGELSQSEAKAFGEDILKSVQSEKDNLEKQVKKMVDTGLKKMIDSMDLVTRKEFDKVKKELADLKKASKSSTTTKKSTAKKSTAKKSTAKKSSSAKKSTTKKKTTTAKKKSSSSRKSAKK